MKRRNFIVAATAALVSPFVLSRSDEYKVGDVVEVRNDDSKKTSIFGKIEAIHDKDHPKHIKNAYGIPFNAHRNEDIYVIRGPDWGNEQFTIYHFRKKCIVRKFS